MTRRTPAMKPGGFLSAVVTDSRAAMSMGRRHMPAAAGVLPDEVPLEAEFMTVREHAPLQHAARAAARAPSESGARTQVDETVRRRSAAPQSAPDQSAAHPASVNKIVNGDAIAGDDPATPGHMPNQVLSAPLRARMAGERDVRQRARADEPVRSAASAPGTDAPDDFHEPATGTVHQLRSAAGAALAEAAATEAAQDSFLDLEIRFADAVPAGAVPGRRAIERETPRRPELPHSDAVSNLAPNAAEPRMAAGGDARDAPNLPRTRLTRRSEPEDIAPQPRRREPRMAPDAPPQGVSPSVQIGSVEVRIEAPAQRPPPPPREPVSFRGSSAASRLYLRRP